MFASVMTDLIGVAVDPAAGLRLAHAHGFSGLDLRLNRYDTWLEDYGVERFRDEMHQLGIKPGYVSLLSRTLSASHEEWEQAIERLPVRAHIARTLGFKRAGVVVMPFDDRRDHAANHRMHVRRLQQVDEVLQTHDIRLGLEYVSTPTRREGHTFPFIISMQGILNLIRDAGTSNVGLMLDTMHWACAQETTTDIEALDPLQIVVVHVCDAAPNLPLEQQVVHIRELPGTTGLYRCDSFMKALTTIGYDGPVTAEPVNPRWLQTPHEQAMAQTAAAVGKLIKTCASNGKGDPK